MIASLKSASLWNKSFAFACLLLFVLSAIDLKFEAALWLSLLLAHLRVLDLEHKLRDLCGSLEDIDFY